MMTNLMDLNDEEFRDEVGARLFDRKGRWDAMLEPEVLDRTRAHLTDICIVVDQQIAKHGDAENNEKWLKRARGYKLQVTRRLADVKARIRARNREETATLAAVERKWVEFAFELGAELEDSNRGHLLDEIMLGDITARQWLDLHEAKQAEKAAA